jgi:hypothetical protein
MEEEMAMRVVVWRSRVLCRSAWVFESEESLTTPFLKVIILLVFARDRVYPTRRAFARVAMVSCPSMIARRIFPVLKAISDAFSPSLFVQVMSAPW